MKPFSLRSPDPNGQDDTLERARDLVLTYGSNPTVYQILNLGIRLWFSGDRTAVAGYVDRPRVRVVAGNPVCEKERLGDVAAELEEATRRDGKRVCYLGADADFAAHFSSAPTHSTIVVGAHPVVDPQQWPHTIKAHASLRAQLLRARNKGVEVHEWFTDHATNHPELRRCLSEWLATRGLPPLHFLVEPDTLDALTDRRILVAQRHGHVVGFLVASPVPGRSGWHIEQLVRGDVAPNGSMELLVDGVMRLLASQGVGYVALGAAPLSPRIPNSPSIPKRLRALLAWQRAHGRRFYNFEGLERFKEKFWPEVWEPVYAISNERRFSLGTMYAVAGAYCGRSPLMTLLQAVGRAGVQELTWLRKKIG